MKKISALLSLAIILVLAACGQNPTNQTTLTSQVFSTSGGDEGAGVAANSTGIYVVARTTGSLDGPSIGLFDGILRKYDPSGAVVWARQFGSTGFDYMVDLAIDSAGNSYVLGQTDGAIGVQVGGKDSFLRKYSPTGAVVWTKQFGTTTDDNPTDVALDSLGNVYVLTGDNYLLPSAGFTLRKFNNSGSLLLKKTIANRTELSSVALAVDSLDNVIVLANWYDSAGTTGLNARLYKYTTGLVQVWQRAYQSNTGWDTAYDITTSGTDIYFTVQFNAGVVGARVVKMNAAGTVLWARSLEPTVSTKSATFPDGIATDSAGNIYVTASNFEESYSGFATAEGYDIIVFKYNSAGNRQWLRQFGEDTGGTHEMDYGLSIAITDGVYVTGATKGDLLGNPKTNFSYDAYLAKLNTTNAATVWIDQ